jgi:hypothetical protein
MKYGMSDGGGDLEDVDEEAVSEFLAEQYEEDPLVREMIDEVRNRQWILENIRNQDLEVQRRIVETILLTSLVGEDELEYYLDQEDGAEIYEQVKSDFENEEVSPDLIQEYFQNAEPAIEKSEDLIENVESELYGSRYSDIQNLRESDRDDADEILSQIKEPIHEDPANEELLTELKGLLSTKNKLWSFPYDSEDTASELPTISGDEYRIHKHYAVQIYKPQIYTQLYRHEEEFEQFPLRWLTHLPVYVMRGLYCSYQEGEMNEEFVKWEVNGEGYLNDLLEEIKKIPPLREREEIIEEAVENYQDERYASTINLLYPQIEFLMWIYAAYLDQETDAEIMLNADYNHFWEFNRRDYDDLALRNINGEVMEKPHIRDLVEETALKEELTPGIVEFFVDELFEDRNPILHGNIIDYYSELQAAKKILFFRNIVEQLIKTITSNVADQAENLMEEEMA